MTDYTELLELLRYCSSQSGCIGCKLSEAYDCTSDLTRDAADAIEELQAEIRESMQKCAECGDRMVEPKRGEWVEENRRPRSSQFVCSECHRTAYDPQPTRDKAWRKRCRYAYCPNCGAKMEVQDG